MKTQTLVAKAIIIVGSAWIFLMISLILCGCSGAPGGPAAPQLSQPGKRKSETPGVDFQNVSKSKHICLFPNRDIAETNSQNDPFKCSISNDGNAIEYSELEKMHMLYNFHYVKYVVRCSTLFGVVDHDERACASAETNPGTQYILSHEWNKSQLWMHSQNGKSQLRMISFLSTATSRIVRTGAPHKVLCDS